MGLFLKEHKRALKMFYPMAELSYSSVLESLTEFLEHEIVPHSVDLDEGKRSIAEFRKELLSKGICQIPLPENQGGLGLPFGVYCLAMELVGSSDASIALSVAIHGTVADGINRFGSVAQKKRYLPEISTGQKLAAFCLTEPSSGSDAKSIHTKAERKGSSFHLNGSKMFITNAGEADFYFVFATTEKGPSAFIVDRDAPGLSFGENFQKLGMKASVTSEVRFQDCIVPSENLVGKEGSGFDYAKQMLNGSRIVMGSLCVGIAQTAYSKALRYSLERRAFGQRIADFQLTKEKIADMKTEIDSARLLCLYAASLRDWGEDFSSESAQSKVFATETSLRVCDKAIQLMGGYGYTSDDMHRHWRDARLLTIGEGTSEVLRLLIANKELRSAQ